MEDNITPNDSLAPSIFDIAQQATKDNATGGTGLFDQEKKIEIDQETSEILVQVPFDIAAYLTKANDIKLVESEYTKLGRLWRKPLERLLSKYEDSDIIIAAIATLGIAGEKYFEYTVNHPSRSTDNGDSPRNEGKRENELRKVESIEPVTIIHS